MKRLVTSLTLALFASPALAHSGAHLHPHSVEGWIVGLGMILTGAVAAYAWKARK